MVALWEIPQRNLLWDSFSHFLLLWLWCRHFWGSSEYRCRSKRVSQMLLMCYNLLQSQNILMNQWHIRRVEPETQYPGTGTPKWDIGTRTRDSICGTQDLWPQYHLVGSGTGDSRPLKWDLGPTNFQVGPGAPEVGR